MIKQFLGKLPKKPSSRSSDTHEVDGQSDSHVSSSNVTKDGDVSNGSPTNPNSAPTLASDSYPGYIHKMNPSHVSNERSNGNIFGTPYGALPSFRDVPYSEKQELFIKKLNICFTVFDFTDPSKNPREKEIKKQTLLELVEYVSSGNSKFPETVIKVVTQMVSVNLFRSFTPQPHDNKVLGVYDMEGEEPSMDPAWPHLQLVYEFFLRFVASPNTDAKLAKKHIDHWFVIKLLDLFDSEDPREREYLKTLLHRVYGKFMVHRPFVRKAVNNIFFRFIFETEKHNGIAELLEVLGSIINGFALPIKEEHKLFLIRALIPLHKPKCLPMYHHQLAYCITQFVEKDCKLADTVIKGLLKYWPVTNTSKEVMLLNELEDILEATQPAEFEKCMVPLFRQIARCLNSSHFQVAERALYLWNNDHIDNLIRQNRRVILPIIFPALERNSHNHWNQLVRSLTVNIRRIFSDIDPELFMECMNKFQEEEEKAEETKMKHEGAWKQLEEIAATRLISNEAKLIPQTVAIKHSS